MSELFVSEEGAALLEAAMVLPILLLLLFGLTDVSLYYWHEGLALKATQLGVRKAVVSNAVAVGPGLDPAESAHYWDGLPPGARCADAAGGVACPSFVVTCHQEQGCRCTGSSCGFRLDARRLMRIVDAMQAVLPDLRPANVVVTYATNGLGYVERPIPVPVEITVSLLGLNYKPLFLGDLLGNALPLQASSSLPGESVLTP